VRLKSVDLMLNRSGFTSCPSTFSVRIKGLCKLKMFDEARGVFGEMALVGLNLSSKDYYHLISGLNKEGDTLG